MKLDRLVFAAAFAAFSGAFAADAEAPAAEPAENPLAAAIRALAPAATEAPAKPAVAAEVPAKPAVSVEESAKPASAAETAPAVPADEKIDVLPQKSAPAGDDRVRKALEDIPLKYKVDSDGDFRVVVGFDDERDQLVFVNSDTVKYDEIEVRKVWSVAATSEDGFPRAKLLSLLEKNSSYKIGSWRIGKIGGKDAAIFYATIPADADGKYLNSIVALISIEADELEKEWSGDDGY